MDVGTRVGCVERIDGRRVFLYGFGTYVGDEVPKGFADGALNPKYVLDDGYEIYDFQCMAAEEYVVRDKIDGMIVEYVTPQDPVEDFKNMHQRNADIMVKEIKDTLEQFIQEHGPKSSLAIDMLSALGIVMSDAIVAYLKMNRIRDEEDPLKALAELAMFKVDSAGIHVDVLKAVNGILVKNGAHPVYDEDYAVREAARQAEDDSEGQVG